MQQAQSLNRGPGFEDRVHGAAHGSGEEWMTKTRAQKLMENIVSYWNAQGYVVLGWLETMQPDENETRDSRHRYAVRTDMIDGLPRKKRLTPVTSMHKPAPRNPGAR